MEIGLGCVNLGSASRSGSMRSQVRLVHEALDLGVTVFDTAGAYGGGGSERTLGRALGHRRGEVRVATKAGYVFREVHEVERVIRRAARPVQQQLAQRRRATGERQHAPRDASRYAEQDFSVGAIRAALDGSLRRLRTDYVDVLQLHGPHELHPGLLGQLEDLVTAGKVRSFGIGAETLPDARPWLGAPGVAVLQVPFGVLDPGAEEVLVEARRHGVEGWARGVLGAGLVGDANERATDHPKAPVVRALGELATATGLQLPDLTLGYVRATGAADAIVLGMSSITHLRENVGRFGASRLDESVLEAVRSVLAEHRLLLEPSS